MKTIILFVVALVVIGCAQTRPPGALDWNYYLIQCDTVAVGTPDQYVYCDTLDADSLGFTIYYSALPDTLYIVLDEVKWPSTIYYTIENDWMYQNNTWYFYCIAWEEYNAFGEIRRRTSAPSDTVFGFFPELSLDSPTNFDVIKFDFK